MPDQAQSEKPTSSTAAEIRVAIPRALRPFLASSDASQPELTLRARDVRELLAELAQKHPQVHVRICDEQGEPRRHINVFVNEDHVRMLDGLDTHLTKGDLVTILPAVSGG